MAESKNSVRIEAECVVKQFVHGHHSRRRYAQELRALSLLAHVDGVPAVLAHDDERRVLVLERIPGEALSGRHGAAPPDAFFDRLRALVATMLDTGIARHAMPPRDILVRPDLTPALVDYERITLREQHGGVLWAGACAVTRFHLLRVIGDYAPHLLSAREARQLMRQRRWQQRFQRFIEWRRRHKRR